MKTLWIGFYNYSVILTYLGLISSVIGMTQALEGKFGTAIACLVISGICDMLDGKVARAMDRTEDEKQFGIQIDSLCDLICFGAFPAFLGYGLGLRGFWGMSAMCLYVLAAVIRLGYFNVMEEKRQQETAEVRKYYQGLPITSMAIILPFIYLIRRSWGSHFLFFTHVAVVVVGILFISDIKVKKPQNPGIMILVGLVALAIARMFHLF